MCVFNWIGRLLSPQPMATNTLANVGRNMMYKKKIIGIGCSVMRMQETYASFRKIFMYHLRVTKMQIQTFIFAREAYESSKSYGGAVSRRGKNIQFYYIWEYVPLSLFFCLNFNALIM